MSARRRVVDRIIRFLDRHVDDGQRPHRFPYPAPDGEYIAWKCAACDEWVSEFREPTPCLVNWRKGKRP